MVGDTLLQTAEKHDIPMFASCGGGGWPRHLFGEGPMCRSCHVYLDNGHVGKALPIEEDEEKILLNIDDRTHKSHTSQQLTPFPPSLHPASPACSLRCLTVCLCACSAVQFAYRV